MTDSISILIIEGEPNLRRECASALTEVSFTVADVRDYPEALLKLNEFKPDMVIVDESLLGRDGIEVCSQLRSTFGVPVVLLGEDSSDEMWERVMEAEVDLYLVKPFSYRELVARVKAILRRYKMARA
ncbi:Phosphate regulon transcriptional regulatory protein PhoB [subsurface metagenome]